MKQKVFHWAGLFLFFLLVWQFLDFSLSRAQDKTDNIALKERFIQEAPMAWEEYMRRAERLQGKVFIQILSSEGRADILYELKMNGDRKLLYMTKERHMKGAKDKDYHTFWVFAINPKYTFGLTRKNAASPWVMAELTLDDPDPEKSFQRQFEMKPGLTQLVRIQEQLLLELIRKPTFRVKRCRLVQHDGEKMAEVVFESPPKIEEQTAVQSGRMLLDPNRLWILRDYNIHQKLSKGSGKVVFHVLELEDSDRSLPVPKRVVCKYDNIMDDGARIIWESRFAYNLTIPDKLPAEE